VETKPDVDDVGSRLAGAPRESFKETFSRRPHVSTDDHTFGLQERREAAPDPVREILVEL